MPGDLGIETKQNDSVERVSEWDYWCPPKGSHLVAPNELQVGIIEGGVATLVAAVVPPLPDWNQMERFASLIREVLASHDWKQPDGLEQWLWDKGISIRFPKVEAPDARHP